MPNWKRGKKSYSVNDIPVQNSTKQIITSLDDGDFSELLNRVSKPQYSRASSGCLPLNSEQSNLIQVCEKNLRDEDAARIEEQRRQERKLNRNRNQVLALSRSPSPNERTSVVPAPYKAIDFDQMNIEYIDAGEGDVEMMDLSGSGVTKKFTKGNPVEVAEEIEWDKDLAAHGGYFYNRTQQQEHVYQRVDDTDEWISPMFNNNNSITTQPTLKSSFSPEDGIKTIEAPVNPKYEEKKRKRNKKVKEGNTVNIDVNHPSYMGNLPVDDIILHIEGKRSETGKSKKSLGDDSSRKEKRRKSKEKKEDIVEAATIGNQQAKDTAAVPEVDTQPPVVVPTKESKTKSPKRRKSTGNSMSRTAAGRCSTEDGDEEFLSADEGVVSSNSDEQVSVHAVTSEVMMDGANYRADDEDLSNIDRQMTEETEFITVSARTKKKNVVAHSQTARTGSTGKVERRSTGAPQKSEAQRRNSLEERPKIAAGPRRPQGASFADFFDERKTETRANAKVVPFKVSKCKNRQDPLDSVTDSDYQDATSDEMAKVPVQNGNSSPEKTFSYADAAKKSSDSRETSPACVTQAAPSVSSTPSPPPGLEQPAVTPATAANNNTSVSMPKSEKLDPSISFFYEKEEKQDKKEEEPKEAPQNDVNANKDFVLNLGGRTVRFAVGMAAPANDQPLDATQKAQADFLRQRWNDFNNKGTPPVDYKPGM